MPSLLIVRGEPYQKGQIIPLNSKTTRIGRLSKKAAPDILFANAYVSSNHLSIRYRNKKFYIKDTNSKNGTELNGVTLQKNEYYALTDGDKISLSNGHILLIFQEEEQRGTMTAVPPEQGILLDDDRCEIKINGRRIMLAGNPYALFRLLYENRGKGVTHDDIRKSVWPDRARDHNGIPFVTEDEVMTTVLRLRRKLQDYPDAIRTVRGHGYMLEEEEGLCRNSGELEN